MKINHHNYEEFFILYWDNELPADQKKLVEQFVSEHADLESEFRIFGETRFSTNESIVLDKNNLLIKEHVSINSSNYQDFLLSYIDNELTEDDKILFESFYKTQPLVQKELNLFQKSKLEPLLAITFPDKSLLYRKEEKVKVLNIKWLRFAAAAVLLLIAGYFGFQFIRTNNPEKTTAIPVATTNDKVLPINQENRTVENNLSPINKAEKIQSPQAIALRNKNISPDHKYTGSHTPESNQITEQTLAVTQTPEESYLLEKIINNAMNIIDDDKSETDFNDLVVTERNSPSFNKQYSNNNVLFASNNDLQEDKGGIKGLLRKATRIFERRTKIQTTTDDNKLLLGAFSVSLK